MNSSAEQSILAAIDDLFVTSRPVGSLAVVRLPPSAHYRIPVSMYPGVHSSEWGSAYRPDGREQQLHHVVDEPRHSTDNYSRNGARAASVGSGRVLDGV